MISGIYPNSFPPALFCRFLVLVFLLGISGEAEAKKRKSKRKKSKRKVHYRTPTVPAIVPLENAESAEFQNFIKKLQGLRNGKSEKVRMLILGDSHMQCEDFGTALNGFLGDSLGIPLAGRGFAFPYPLARSNHRSDLSFGPKEGWHGCRFTRSDNRCEWGLAGWTAHMERDSADFFWKMKHRNFEAGDTVLLFSPPGSARSHCLRMADSSGQAQNLEYDKSINAFRAIVPKRGPAMNFRIIRREPEKEFVLQGLLRKPQSPGLITGISGTNGARLDHYLLNPDFQKHMREINPDLVLISLGTNDAFTRPFGPKEIQAFLSLLLARVKAAAPSAAILLAGPPDHCIRKGKPNPATEEVNRVFSQTAEELDFVFWNQQSAMGGRGSVFDWRCQNLSTPDLIHFSPAGYRKQALLLFRSMEKHFSAKH